ncbi:hypothetical protein HQN64_24030 [Enterobacteriaceae bacterium BIT-l23]|uniref:hypothetical protein n=1 Tax=Jejubacter sp. L23 TaxID=3092086 RepID=UPI001584DD09|nr:hypothetical protein [Enterobacteriaceae bacterium BIT-l23]
MKRLLFFVLAAAVSPVVMAMQMEGFGASYYHDDSSIISHDANKNLVPDVIVGSDIFVMEFSHLADIAKVTGVVINQDDRASWLCLASKSVNYWFISDNEMGQGDLTSIAIARDGRQKGCSPYSNDLSVRVKGVPLLGVSSENFASVLKGKPGDNIIQYCNDTQKYGDFIQMNCLQYYLENKVVEGVLISQVTSN